MKYCYDKHMESMASRNSKIIQKGARVEKNGQGIIQKTSDGERRTVEDSKTSS